jgi:DNA invertase Pin-like site-specific DNA recombinase
VEFVKESLVFTGKDSPMASLMLSAMGAFVEFKRSLIREWQREGIALAKQRGAYPGRKKTLRPERTAELIQRAANGIHKFVLASDYAISRETAKAPNQNRQLPGVAAWVWDPFAVDRNHRAAPGTQYTYAAQARPLVFPREYAVPGGWQ